MEELGNLKRHIDGAADSRQNFGPGLLAVKPIGLREANNGVHACADRKPYQLGVMQI